MAKVAFVKMQGLGNDYVFVDGIANRLPADLPAASRRVADRPFGVGGGGLIAILPGESAPFRMRMFNADGSEGEMCGNGLRAFAKYVFESGYVRDEEFDVETTAGIVRPRVIVEGGRVERVRVDMGAPRLDRRSIPRAGDPSGTCVDEAIRLGGADVHATCVSMGNPHCVIFVEDTRAAPVTTLGAAIERDPTFPGRANVSFVAVRNRRELEMRVWERGSGETLACGTGACAAAVAAAITGRADREVAVHLPGGTLGIEWSDRVFMTGPAVEVFRGEIDLE